MDTKKIGYVLFFDNAKGEGVVICPEDQFAHYYVHYSAISSDDKFKKLNKSQIVLFTLYENIYMKQIDFIVKADFESSRVDQLLDFLLWEGMDLTVGKIGEEYEKTRKTD